MIDKLIHSKKAFDVPIPKSKFELVQLGFEMGVILLIYISLVKKAQRHLLIVNLFPEFSCTTKGRLDIIQKTVIYCCNITKSSELILCQAMVPEYMLSFEAHYNNFCHFCNISLSVSI